MNYHLEVEKREKNGTKTREEGKIPGVLYGASLESVSISLNSLSFEKLYKEAGESSLINLKLGEKDLGKVLVKDIQHDPVKGKITHVDLQRIDMNKPLTAYVSLVFVGVAPAVKELGGILVKNVEEVEVECLPKDLVSEISVDLNSLATFDDVIKVGDLKLPNGFVVLSPGIENPIVSVNAPLTDDQIAAMEAENTVDVTKVEVEGDKKDGAVAGENADEKKEQKKEEKK